jgi:hypothetical protein
MLPAIDFLFQESKVMICMEPGFFLFQKREKEKVGGGGFIFGYFAYCAWTLASS